MPIILAELINNLIIYLEKRFTSNWSFKLGVLEKFYEGRLSWFPWKSTSVHVAELRNSFYCYDIKRSIRIAKPDRNGRFSTIHYFTTGLACHSTLLQVSRKDEFVEVAAAVIVPDN